MASTIVGEMFQTFFRRRHQPRRPPLAKIRPGRPASTMGPGTDAAVDTSIIESPLPKTPA
jgi:hypothetical protein